ncbi:MAG: hypothetical protein KGO94_05940 [Alphaproteobacteria bacterium]|nr:hypothetical protein [Alphaproteobacteria bacterium]
MAILQRNFPNLQSLIAVTLTSPDSGVLKNARTAVIVGLEAQHDEFDMVFAPGTGEYYETHAMLYHSREEIEARAAYALSLRPLFSAIAQAPSADSLSTLVTEVSGAIKQGRDPQGLDDLFDQSAKSLQALMQGANLPVDWTVIAGLNVDPSPTTSVILVLPKPGRDQIALSALKQTLATVAQQTAAKATVETTIPPAIRNANTESDRSVQMVILALILVCLVLGSGLGRVNVVTLVLLPVAVALCASGVLASLLLPAHIFALWPVFGAVALEALIMAVRAALALVEARRESRNPEISIMLAAQRQGAGLAKLAALNAAVWLGLLVSGAQRQISITATALAGLAAGYFAAQFLVPALAKLFGSTIGWLAEAWIDPIYKALFHNSIWPKFRLTLTFLLIAAAVAGAVIAPQALKPVVTEIATSQPVNIVVGSTTDAQAVLTKLQSIPQAGSVRWLGAFLPQEVEAKLKALASLQDQFPKIGTLNAQTPDDLRYQISTLQETLTEIASLPATRPALAAAANTLRQSLEVLGATSANTEIIEVENRIFGHFNDLAARANFLATLAKPDMATLDPRLKTLFLSPTNIYRLEVMPVLGVSNAQLARLLYDSNLAVAHPSLVTESALQSAKTNFTIVLAAVVVLGLAALAITIGEVAGIVAAGIVTALLLGLFGGAIAWWQFAFDETLLLVGAGLVALCYGVIATTFLKAEVSSIGAPAALHATEAWLPSLLIWACAIPIILLGTDLQLPNALMMAAGSALSVSAIGFLLRPLTLALRRAASDT